MRSGDLLRITRVSFTLISPSLMVFFCLQIAFFENPSRKGRSDVRMDVQMDALTYRDARTHEKKTQAFRDLRADAKSRVPVISSDRFFTEYSNKSI